MTVRHGVDRRIFLEWTASIFGSSMQPSIKLGGLCAKVRPDGVEPIFSATPPLEALRVLLCLLCVACQEDICRVEDPFLISIAGVSGAHFYADAACDVNIRLPNEDPKARKPGVCGKLRKTMYGSLDAAQRWRENYAKVLEAGGFSRGEASPCHFFHEGLQTFVLVHGDDFS